MIRTYEIHFQEGFDGDAVTIDCGDTHRTIAALNTRMQLGLAEIVQLDAKPGQVLKIALADSNEPAQIKLSAKHGYVKVNKADNRIALETSDVSPGYL